MKRLFKRLVILAVLVGVGAVLWSQRDRVAGIHNNKLRVQGTWYQYEMNRKGFDPYFFTERIISRDGIEWASYELRSNNEIEVTVGDELSVYELSFPDEDNMVWSTEIDGDTVAVMRWQR